MQCLVEKDFEFQISNLTIGARRRINPRVELPYSASKFVRFSHSPRNIASRLEP